MSRKLKFSILVVSFSLLLWLFFQPLHKLGISKPYNEPPVAGQKIDAYELNEFLSLWSKIMQGPLNKYIKQISLSSRAEYPTRVVKWLEAQNWNVERFFYNEQRLHELLDYVNLRANLNSNINLQQKGNVNLTDLINEQKKRLKMCPYSNDELDLVEANMYQITEIFAGRAVLASGN